MSEDPHKHQPNEEAPSSGLGPSSRRSFLSGVGAAGLAASLSPFSAAETAVPAPDVPHQGGTAFSRAGAMVNIRLRVNGKDHDVRIDPRSSLLDCLRENLHLTGTKKGCDHGQCGACTVHINGRRANSCLSLALTNVGDEITTIEGVGTPQKLHPLQAAFVEHDGYQCGYCTSGQIMSAVALLKEPCGAADTDVKEAMSGNICRCGAYANIVDAIQKVRGKS
ncbi:MAG: oxidoreductase [Chthonomonadaceae bacterium]|nr:oxidoreductase [Chthonomonadaceae bacterium]